jgi:ribonucleoside-triphosphate reductase
MRARLLEYQDETGNLWNLEASPAESTCYRLAKHDQAMFNGEIVHAGTEASPYYTNSTHLPVNATEDIFEALELQEPLQTSYTGGTVLHGFIGEQVDAEMAKVIVKKAFTNFRLPYLSLTPTFSVCSDHGYIAGEEFNCPVCGKDTEVYSRITGYYRAIDRWNIGKKQEFKDRREYSVDNKNNGESS